MPNTPTIWRPFTQMAHFNDFPKAKSALGAIINMEDGRQLIDSISSWWVISHGHGIPAIAEAIGQQAQQLEQVLFGNFSHSPAELLTQKLSEFLDPTLDCFFFSDNGSTAVEVAIKMVLQNWHHLNEPHRNKFISFERAYHGDTLGAMSASGPSIFTDPFKKLLFNVLHAKHSTKFNDAIENYTSHFLELLNKHKDELAGIIIEPIVQGAGGMVVWPLEALNLIMKACRQYNIPIIFDEVMTGFGRTGSFFAYDQLNFVPDYICLSKGLTGGYLPMSLTVTNKKVYNNFYSNDKYKMFFHGHSFTANPIACAAALANLNVFETYDWKSNIEIINKINISRLKQLDHYNISNPRFSGVIAAFELNNSSKVNNSNYLSDIALKLFKFGLKNGVFIRPLGNTIYLLPPYQITTDELNKVWDVIESFLKSITPN